MTSLIALSGPTTKTVRTVALSAAVRPSEVSPAPWGSMPKSLEILSSGSPIIGKFGACHGAEFGGADRGEVLGVAEQDAPGVTEPLVKADAALRGVRFEIRRGLADLDHDLVVSDCFLAVAMAPGGGRRRTRIWSHGRIDSRAGAIPFRPFNRRRGARRRRGWR